MRIVQLQTIVDGKRRIAVPKEKVNGWRHTSGWGIHIYARGHIGYIVDTEPENGGGATLEKFDYKRFEYLDIQSYDEFRKFCDIKVVDEQ